MIHLLLWLLTEVGHHHHHLHHVRLILPVPPWPHQPVPGSTCTPGGVCT